MARLEYKNPITGQKVPLGVKVEDTLPIGSEVDIPNGTPIPDGWIEVEDGSTIVSSSEPSGNDRRKVWLRHGNNLFNSSGFNWATGTTLEYTSIYVGVGTYTIFSPNMPVGINNVANFFILANKVTTGADTATNGVDKNNVRTVTSTDGYLTIANRASTGNNPYAPKDYKFMINSGSTALDYEDYVYNKTYILNDNDIYEEYKPNEFILWENSNPSSAFAPQDINLATDDYTYYEIIYAEQVGFARYASTGKLKKGYSCSLQAFRLSSNSAPQIWRRPINYSSDTKLVAEKGQTQVTNTTTASDNNGVLAPVMIIGYR